MSSEVQVSQEVLTRFNAMWSLVQKESSASERAAGEELALGWFSHQVEMLDPQAKKAYKESAEKARRSLRMLDSLGLLPKREDPPTSH